jgi:hypothetical protein
MKARLLATLTFVAMWLTGTADAQYRYYHDDYSRDSYSHTERTVGALVGLAAIVAADRYVNRHYRSRYRYRDPYFYRYDYRHDYPRYYQPRYRSYGRPYYRGHRYYNAPPRRYRHW